MRLLKHDLECRNLANMMYIIAAERHRTQEEEIVMTENFRITMEDMAFQIINAQNQILDLQKSKDVQADQIGSWEKHALSLICEFQRFINCILRAYPSQAAYIISLQNFICKHLKGSRPGPENKLLEKVQSIPIMGKKNTQQDEAISCTCSQKRREVECVENCIHMEALNTKPNFIYNKHMYIQEDFRHMHIVPDDPKMEKMW